MSAPHLVLYLVALERLAELVLAHRNTRRLLRDGAVEHGARHYPLFVLLHASWLLAMFLAVQPGARVIWPLLAVYALLMLGRVWVMASLGRFWTTRVITLPTAALTRRGPYRFLRHPNYAIVAGEIAVLPLAFGLWPIALVFSLLNALLIRHRVRIENEALASRAAF